MAEESTPSSKCIENEVYNDPILKSRSSTHNEFVKLRHTWTIHNFSLCSEKLVSPTFSAKNNQWNDNSEWRLALFPKGDNQDSSKFVSVYIYLATSNLKEIQVKYKLGIVNVSGADTNIIEDLAQFVKGPSAWGDDEFVLQDYLLNQKNMLLLDDTLTVFCEITVRVVIEYNSQTLPTSKSELSKVLHVNKYYDCAVAARDIMKQVRIFGSAAALQHIGNNRHCDCEYDYPIFKSRSSTHIKIVKFRHTWTVNKFDHSWSDNGEKLISPTFSAGKNRWNDKSEWCFLLYPKGDNIENYEYVSLYLMLNAYHVNKIQAKCKLGIVNADGKVIKELPELSHPFTKGKSDYGFPQFIKLSDLYNKENKFVVDDKLIIFCEITIILGTNNTSEILTTTQSDLPKDFDFLLGTSEFSDLTLSVDGKEYPAHKVILAAQSPVFRAMFKHDMAESRKNRVEITDLDEEGLNEMLRYMYTGKIHNLRHMAPRLLGMAEKYAMDGLKIKCEEALYENLSLANATETLILSDTFRATELKEKVKSFIVAHASDIGKTPRFASMVRTHPHLGVEAFCALSNSSIT